MKKRVHRIIVEGIMLYIMLKPRDKLQALEMNMTKRSSRISKLQHKHNIVIKGRMNLKRSYKTLCTIDRHLENPQKDFLKQWQ